MAQRKHSSGLCVCAERDKTPCRAPEMLQWAEVRRLGMSQDPGRPKKDPKLGFYGSISFPSPQSHKCGSSWKSHWEGRMGKSEKVPNFSLNISGAGERNGQTQGHGIQTNLCWKIRIFCLRPFTTLSSLPGLKDMEELGSWLSLA